MAYKKIAKVKRVSKRWRKKYNRNSAEKYRVGNEYFEHKDVAKAKAKQLNLQHKAQQIANNEKAQHFYRKKLNGKLTPEEMKEYGEAVANMSNGQLKRNIEMDNQRTLAGQGTGKKSIYAEEKKAELVDIKIQDLAKKKERRHELAKVALEGGIKTAQSMLPLAAILPVVKSIVDEDD